ncbi:hypothetical protein PR003_g10098 [Phytophthora rubi]|uniref:Secreted protein n=1 Tax=Phytophthora rubi TaxID=129364 RepID=A0A6A4FGA2_9STRA|nr:hypothetical protein PR002_g11328 [Phytophthora rubi]KAE9035895.1 hypothetical protein PR001_g9096 [Phytophthora rubi]KAE9341213.1 hypothetical protein PR003_g10098 [Phytophthora rubi]
MFTIHIVFAGCTATCSAYMYRGTASFLCSCKLGTVSTDQIRLDSFELTLEYILVRYSSIPSRYDANTRSWRPVPWGNESRTG